MAAPAKEISRDFPRIRLHAQEAQNLAFRIFSYSSSLMPLEWKDAYSSTVISDVFSFAVHARILNQLLGWDTKTRNISFSILDFSTPQTRLSRYDHALNRIVHAHDLIVGFTDMACAEKFPGTSALLSLTHVVMSSDRHPLEVISLSGLSTCFLNDVMRDVNDIHAMSQS